MTENTPTTIRECLAALPPAQLRSFMDGLDLSLEFSEDRPAINAWFNVLRGAAEVEGRTRTGDMTGSLTFWEALLMTAAGELTDSDIEQLLPIHRAQFNGNAEIPFKSPIALIGGICVICLQLELERRDQPALVA